jgi:hypothetical protein
MTLIDRLLRRVGLMRCSQIAYTNLEVNWQVGEPAHIDLRFKDGQRVVGAVDSFYPNPNPLFATFRAPP